MRRALSSLAHGGLLGEEDGHGLGDDSDSLLQQLGSDAIVGDAATAQSEAAAAKRAADRALSTVAQINSQQAAAQAEFDGTWAINVFQWTRATS